MNPNKIATGLCLLLLPFLGLALLSLSAHAEDLGCGEPADESFDADRTRWYELADPTGLGAVYSVTHYQGKETDRTSNFGFRGYMADSVVGDTKLYQAAAGFYSQLAEIDMNVRADAIQFSELRVSIDRLTPVDLWSLAYRHASGDAYRALKLLAVYGHDDVNHSLVNSRSTESCRVPALNRVAPGTSSILYLNGAIGALVYPVEWIAEGMQVGAACNDPAFAGSQAADSAYYRYCNDFHEYYRPDYYHVIASAFLGCRRLVMQDQIPFRGAIMGWAEKKVLALYLNEVAKYKLARFYEEVEMAQQTGIMGAPSEVGTAYFIRRNLASISAGQGPHYPTTNEMDHYGMDRGQKKLVVALIHRHDFEVRFRVFQHEMGMQFGREVCSR